MAFDTLFSSDPDPENAFHRAVLSLRTEAKLLALVACFAALFIVQSLAVLAVLTVAAGLLAAAFGVGKRDLASVFAPFAVIASIAIVAQVLYCRTGDVLFEVGSFAIYADAFRLSGAFLLRFAGALLANVAFMKCVSLRDLMACLSALLSPLEKVGIRSGMFVMALEAAFVALPLLVEAFDARNAVQKGVRQASAPCSVREKARLLGDAFGDFFDRSFESVDAVIVEMMKDPSRR